MDAKEQAVNVTARRVSSTQHLTGVTNEQNSTVKTTQVSAHAPPGNEAKTMAKLRKKRET